MPFHAHSLSRFRRDLLISLFRQEREYRTDHGAAVGRPLPCQRNIKRTVASPRTCCVCPTSIIPRLPFCKALVRLPPSERTRSRSTTLLPGTAPNRVWHLA